MCGRDCVTELGWFFRTVLKDPYLCIPVFAYLAANFAGALHSPILQFFYESIGAAPDQIGNIAIARSISVLLLSPLYGKLVDQGYTVEVMVASWAFCSTGCFVRGLANSVNQLYLSSVFMGFSGSVDGLMLAHLSLNFPCTGEKRALIVSSFSALSTATMLLGRGLFPLSMKVLQRVVEGSSLAQRIYRFRILVNICTIGCLVGLVSLLYVFCMRACRRRERDLGKSRSDDMVDGGRVEIAEMRLKMPMTWDVALALSLVVITMAMTLTNTLWPLFLEKQFGWSSTDYGYAVIVLSLARIACLSLLPAVSKRIQLISILQVTMISSSIFGLLGFVGSSSALNVVCMVSAYSLLSVADSTLKAEFTRSMSRSFQGRAWGGLAALVEIGKIVGASSIHLVSSSYTLPFTVVFTSVLLCALPLALASYYCRQPKYSPVDVASEESAVELT